MEINYVNFQRINTRKSEKVFIPVSPENLCCLHKRQNSLCYFIFKLIKKYSKMLFIYIVYVLYSLSPNKSGNGSTRSTRGIKC